MRTVTTNLIVGIALLAAAAALDLRLVERASQRPFDVMHVPSGSIARIAALGHRTFVSDLYWLSTVQYIGDPRVSERGYGKLHALVDLVTDLDPRHGYAYQTAGIVLSSNGLIEESNRILMKGIERGPRWWSYPFYIAFNYWFYEGDYERGAEWADKAARTPGASTNISHLALSLRSKTGRPQDALDMLLEMRKVVKDEASAAKLDEQIKLAILERDAQWLEGAARRYRAERGHDIAALEDLVRRGYVAAIPPDPFGGVYVWHRDEGKVHSSANPFRFSLREPGQRPRPAPLR